jgi:hypothetical protein
MALTSCVLLAFACKSPQKYRTTSSAKAPGADAQIAAEVRMGQDQTMLDVVAENLAPPSRVATGAHTYVLFVRRDASGKWSRIGALAYDESQRRGTFLGSAPETSFDLVVTAEASTASESPTAENEVFAQRVN